MILRLVWEIAGFGDQTNKARSGHCSGRRSKIKMQSFERVSIYIRNKADFPESALLSLTIIKIYLRSWGTQFGVMTWKSFPTLILPTLSSSLPESSRSSRLSRLSLMTGIWLESRVSAPFEDADDGPSKLIK